MPAQKRKADEVTPDNDTTLDSVVHLTAHEVVAGLASSNVRVRQAVERALLIALGNAISGERSHQRSLASER
jgi:hypothetical protein